MRHWKNDGQDGGSIHTLGNGMLCAYEQGPNITQLFGPPYSSPSFLKLVIQMQEDVEAVSTREPGTAVWRHEISVEGAPAATFTDYIPPGFPCLVRVVDCRLALTLVLKYEAPVSAVDNTARFGPAPGFTALLARVEAGAPIYWHYPTVTEHFQQALLTGGIRCRRTGESVYELTLPAGRSAIFFCGGPSYPEATACAEKALNANAEALLAETRNWWGAFARRRKDFGSSIPSNFPQKARLLELIDSVAVLIKAQQGIEGGVVAGHNYHLAYVRDQYGVSRGLLSLGYLEEAKAILSYYWDVWRRRGELHNAQGIGADFFHIHENDDIEITGYLIIQAFDYLKASGDEAFIRTIFPMLAWAFEAQKKRLVRHMLPFNGDETYIAGGLLPRECINDGSSEATMLFLESGGRLLDLAVKCGLWSTAIAEENASLLRETELHYSENFLVDGRPITNNPARLEGLELPRFRHGVCQACGGFFRWTELMKEGLYACPQCMAGGKTGQCAAHKVLMLKSVSLMPMFIGSALISREELGSMIGDIAAEFRRTGRLPSKPDSDDTVGYDYGLLLYNLALLGHPSAHDVFACMLSVVDDADAWVEYYKDGIPYNTRCRPWESGINIHAAVEFAQRYHQ